MFGGKKEKALQDELYTIKKQIAEYSDELKEDSVQMTASRVQMEENIEILEEKLECVGAVQTYQSLPILIQHQQVHHHSRHLLTETGT